MQGRLKAAALWLVSLGTGFGVGSVGSGTPSGLWFLSVGQGDCAVFRHAGVTVLIDAGPAPQGSDGPGTQIARRLREMGVSKVDLVLLSHPDSDHVGGLRGIARLIPIRRVAAMSHFRGSADLGLWLKWAGFNQAGLLWIERGTSLRIGAFDARVDSARFLPGDPDNFGSMFIHIEGMGASADLTGDADALAETLVLHDGNWAAQILKAGHHGSRTATSEAWLKAVRPQTVVISCGPDNSYGHPAKETLERIERAGAKAARTDREGDIVFEVKEGGFVRVK